MNGDEAVIALEEIANQSDYLHRRALLIDQREIGHIAVEACGIGKFA